MTAEEKEVYDLLVAVADAIKDGKDIDYDEVVNQMTKIMEEYAKTGAEEGAKALEMLADKDIAGEIAKIITNGDVFISKGLSERLNSRASELVKGYADYTQKQVEEVLNSSKSMTANEIKSRLAQVMPTSRAELIARNETNYAIRSGRLEQDMALAEKYGLDVKLVWRTSHDDDVCPVCAAMDGKTVELGKAFTDTAETKDGEIVSWEHSSWNDDGKIPDAHPNCRCYFDEELV